MTKPDVTLQPSKGIVAESATQIYSAYIAAGRVSDEDRDEWIKRSIQEAVTIARTVSSSLQSDQELPEKEDSVRGSSTESRLAEGPPDKEKLASEGDEDLIPG